MQLRGKTSDGEVKSYLRSFAARPSVSRAIQSGGSVASHPLSLVVLDTGLLENSRTNERATHAYVQSVGNEPDMHGGISRRSRRSSMDSAFVVFHLEMNRNDEGDGLVRLTEVFHALIERILR